MTTNTETRKTNYIEAQKKSTLQFVPLFPRLLARSLGLLFLFQYFVGLNKIYSRFTVWLFPQRRASNFQFCYFHRDNQISLQTLQMELEEYIRNVGFGTSASIMVEVIKNSNWTQLIWVQHRAGVWQILPVFMDVVTMTRTGDVHSEK